MPGIYDDGESYDASDHGPVTVPPEVERALLEELLESLYAAGFREGMS